MTNRMPDAVSMLAVNGLRVCRGRIGAELLALFFVDRDRVAV